MVTDYGDSNSVQSMNIHDKAHSQSGVWDQETRGHGEKR